MPYRCASVCAFAEWDLREFPVVCSRYEMGSRGGLYALPKVLVLFYILDFRLWILDY